jgi:flavoprotein family protein
MKVVIIGGGASGITSAITARRKGYDVVVLEKNSSLLKKLKITGNGHCNYYNEDQDLCHYHSDNSELISMMINSVNLENVSLFFDSIGIIPRIKNGYYYPFSNQAISVCSSLILEAQKLGVVLDTDVEVQEVKKSNRFQIITTNGVYEADKVIVSTGGMSYQKTGSDGFGYRELKRLGHNINLLLPGLTPLIIANPKKEWKGIRTDVSISLLENNKLVRKESGEIQLTEDGISGICTMQLSSYISKGLYLGKDERIKINFLPFIDEDEFFVFMDNRSRKMKNRTVMELLEGVLNYKLISVILKKKQNLIWDECNNKEREFIKKNLLSYMVEVVDTKSFNYSQVTLGGVSLLEVNLETMESKKVKDLYITGELLDITGDCGGYNLTIAWITGLIAGECL